MVKRLPARGSTEKASAAALEDFDTVTDRQVIRDDDGSLYVVTSYSDGPAERTPYTPENDH